MVVELVRLGVGLAMLIFYRRIAEYVLVRERALVVLFRQRGVPLPLLTEHTTENIYFGLAVFGLPAAVRAHLDNAALELFPRRFCIYVTA